MIVANWGSWQICYVVSSFKNVNKTYVMLFKALSKKFHKNLSAYASIYTKIQNQSVVITTLYAVITQTY